MYTILGNGLAGISCSYHLGHQNCTIFEKQNYSGGHIYSEHLNGFIWDEGPHVSFTKHNYVKELFAKSVDNNFLEYRVSPGNYYEGNWIPHPAQANLYAIPEPLRSEILNDFLNTRETQMVEESPQNYEEWLSRAFGKTFTDIFPATYTEKYWTIPPSMLGVDWIENRVFYPDIETVKNGFFAPPRDSNHYITQVRYPAGGGYMQFASKMLQNCNVHYNKIVQEIDLHKKVIVFGDASEHHYERLISTIPITEFVRYCRPPQLVSAAIDELACSQLLLINIEVKHSSIRAEQWLYVYDVDKLSTRINFTELLSPCNAPASKSGIQVEVYFSKFKPIAEPFEFYANKVTDELIEMGLIMGKEAIINVHTRWVPFANVIFDLNYKTALNTLLSWLEGFGLVREVDDLNPVTNWNEKLAEKISLGNLTMAGRFAQWKYFWSDDCVLRGLFIQSK